MQNPPEKVESGAAIDVGCILQFSWDRGEESAQDHDVAR